MNHRILAVVLLAPGLLGLAPEPPRAEKVPHVRDVNGQKFEDPYFWLRQRDNPKVLEHLKAENAYYKEMTEHTGALQKTLYEEMLGRIKQTDLSVPYQQKGY